MAYYRNIPATKTSFNGGSALSANTLFTCTKGLLGISTDGAPATVTDVTAGVTRPAILTEQYRSLEEGQSLLVTAGLTVVYQRLNQDNACDMHTMPA